MSDNEEPDFDIDNYTVSGVAHIRVGVDNLPATGRILGGHYGNAAASSGEDKEGTYYANFSAVLHFNKINQTDATSVGNDVVAQTEMGESKIVKGMIANAINLDGSDWLSNATPSQFASGNSPRTICHWANISMTPDYQPMVGYGPDTTCNAFFTTKYATEWWGWFHTCDFDTNVEATTGWHLSGRTRPASRPSTACVAPTTATTAPCGSSAG